MNPVDPVEYVLTLNTGEKLQVSELSEGAVEELTDISVLHELNGLLSRCTEVRHSCLEEAKLGNTKPLEKALRSPPFACMSKLDKPVCSQIGCCVMADVRKCTTRNADEKGGRFPECWEYACGQGSAGLARAVVHGWRQGRYVLIVRND